MPAKSKVPRTEWKVCLSSLTAAQVENRLFDRVHGKPHYGLRGELIERLLREWLDRTSTNPEAALLELLENE